MADPLIGAVIVRHIDELEAALRHANNSMLPELSKHAAEVINSKRKTLGWAGEVPHDLTQDIWLAPNDWRMDGDTDDSFDLYLELDFTDCIDGQEPETWIGIFCGFAGAQLRFVFSSNLVGQRDWKTILKAQQELMDKLIAKGFLYDPRTGELAVLVQIDRQALADAFEEEDFEVAFQPISVALDRVNLARSELDQLVTSIRKGR